MTNKQDWYQGYSPDTTDAEAIRLFELKHGYKPLTLTRYHKSALLAGPIGKREYATGDQITRNGQTYTVAEVQKTSGGFTILATGADGEPNILEV